MNFETRSGAVRVHRPPFRVFWFHVLVCGRCVPLVATFFCKLWVQHGACARRVAACVHILSIYRRFDVPCPYSAANHRQNVFDARAQVDFLMALCPAARLCVTSCCSSVFHTLCTMQWRSRSNKEFHSTCYNHDHLHDADFWT